MVSFDELLKMDPNMTEEELRARNLLPPKPVAVPPTAIPAAASTGTAVAPMSRPVVPPRSTTPNPEPDVKPMVPPNLAGPQVAPMQPPNLDFHQRQALPTISPGAPIGSAANHEAQLTKMKDRDANPWGSPENHPGFFGKLGHIASKVGNIAGDIVAPSTMALIPGTDLNKQVVESNEERKLAGAKKEEAGEKLATARESSEENLRQTEEQKNLAEAEKAKHPPELPGKTPEEATLHDLMTGENGQPRVNPDTGKPYTYLEAYESIKNTAQGVKTPPLAADQLTQLNNGLTHRYQVLNPGKPLPPEFTLPANASQKDYDRIDKLMESTEKAQGTKTQQDQVNEMRKQTQETAKQNQKDREDKEGMKWASWEENGKQVAGPVSMAKAHGVTEMSEVPAQEVRDITNARHAVRLMTKTGDPNKPETQGVLQLIDSLDKDGKLGVLASRWNSLLATGVGTSPGDDPRIITLLDKNMLGDTAAMLAHFGASGGRSPQMLQHFLDLANSRKMDGVTLRAGVKAMVDYMQDRAQMPEKGTANGEAGKPEGKVSGEGEELKPPHAADPGMKWQHRTVDGKVKWRQTKEQP